MTARTPADRRQQANAMPPLPDADAADIAAFLEAIWAESGLARPSLDSYRRDLEGFARWYMMIAPEACILEPEALKTIVRQLSEKILENLNH